VKQRAVVLALLLLTALAAAASLWKRLEEDGLHDPKSPAIGLLQQPAEALAPLPRDGAGNLVNWVQAIESGAIDPRTNLFAGTEVRVREDAILVARYGSLPSVVFPHRAHTLWLDCSNCHDRLFKAERGANRLSMSAILEGEQCGVCHGAVAFPLTECNRCHSLPHSQVRQFEQRQRELQAARERQASPPSPSPAPNPGPKTP